MSRFASLSRFVSVHPIERLHRRKAVVAESSPDRSVRNEHACTETERLERISMYARAGYFHMSYTLEMYALVGELPPE